MSELQPTDAQVPHDLEEPFATEGEERACVERVRAGDVNAFEALYRAYWHPLYAFAFRYLQTKEDAEEAVQDVFFRIWRGRAEWRPIGPVSKYLYLAVRNTARDRFRRTEVAGRWRQREMGALSGLAAASAPEIDAHIESAETAAAVERALAELPLRRRAVCTLRLMDHLSYAEIAQRLGINVKTVENHLAAGLKFLRDRLHRRD